MPLISLDEYVELVRKLPNYEFLCSRPQDLLPEPTHKLLESVGAQHLWQLLSFSRRELEDQWVKYGTRPEAHQLIELVESYLSMREQRLRDSSPFALQIEGRRHLKLLSETTYTTSEYADATHFWNRWEAMRARAKLPATPCKIVFRSETIRCIKSVA